MQPNKYFYPDANSTMRCTYGKIKDYSPKDAVHFSHFTTLKGIMEKKILQATSLQFPQNSKNYIKIKTMDNMPEKMEKCRLVSSPQMILLEEIAEAL